MKLRDLKHWPPAWVGLSKRSETSAVVEEGVLESVERLGNRLLLRINVNGHRRTASLVWDPPPGVRAVEAVLLASIGAEIRDLADREVPSSTGGARPVA
ncbi:MAG TPA: hypothetical protein VJX92_12210 [Methylomirabilota bacterium]|nr:hypothetical protein [Methylomirabilota bacterium]